MWKPVGIRIKLQKKGKETMKKLRGFISLLLVMMLVMGLSAVAMAAEGDTYTITIKNESAAHTYEAYQIFKG